MMELNPKWKATSGSIGMHCELDLERICFTCTSPTDVDFRWMIIHAPIIFACAMVTFL